MDSQKIVDILAHDSTVVSRWLELYDKLGLSMDIDRMQKGRNNGNLNNHELFREIIKGWMSEKGSKGSVQILCQALEHIKCVDASEKIQEALKIIGLDSAKRIFFEFEPLSKNFTGRCEEIDKIQKMLTTTFVLITGMGGLGKTELAKKFAHLHKEWNCIWLNAENAHILQASVTRLGESLGVRTGSIKFKDLFRSCLESIIKNQPFQTLVIMDNVDVEFDEALTVIEVIKDLNCFAIVTSRLVTVMGYSREPILFLKTLKQDEGIQLLESSLKGESSQDILSLCRELDLFPLALQQAVAYIQRQQLLSEFTGILFKIPQYLQLFAKMKTTILNFPVHRLDHKYGLTTFITWNTSIEAIEAEGSIGKLSIDLLNSIAFMEADKIPIKFMMGIYGQLDASTSQFEKAMKLLIAYSLVSARDGCINIHRLVQDVVRISFADNQVIIKLIHAIDKVIQSSNYGCLQAEHIVSVWKYLSKLDDKDLEREVMEERINVINFIFNNLDCKPFLNYDFDNRVYKNFSESSFTIATRVLEEDDRLRLIIQSRASTLPPFLTSYEKDELTLKIVLAKQSAMNEEAESLITAYALIYTLFKLEKYDLACDHFNYIRHRHHHWDKFLFDVIQEIFIIIRLKECAIVDQVGEVYENGLKSIILKWGEDQWVTRVRNGLHQDLFTFYKPKEIKPDHMERLLVIWTRVLGVNHKNVIDLKKEIAAIYKQHKHQLSSWDDMFNTNTTPIFKNMS